MNILDNESSDGHSHIKRNIEQINNSVFSFRQPINFREANTMQEVIDNSLSQKETNLNQLGINTQEEKASRESCFVVLLINSFLWALLLAFSAFLIIKSNEKSDEYIVLKQLFAWLCILESFFVTGIVFSWLSLKSKKKDDSLYQHYFENWIENVMHKKEINIK